jgi:hypothetical protein
MSHCDAVVSHCDMVGVALRHGLLRLRHDGFRADSSPAREGPFRETLT